MVQESYRATGNGPELQRMVFILVNNAIANLKLVIGREGKMLDLESKRN
jgi:hypothetical protein